jgi:hypothetical protein
MTPHLCSTPGCPNVVEGPGKCAEHGVDGWSKWKRTTANGASRTGNAYGWRWTRVRDERMRIAHGRCEVCGKPATSVHHTRHQTPDAPDFYSVDAVIAVCDGCHRRLSQRSRRLAGGGA